MRNPAKLAMVARKKTIQSFRDKFYPSYGDMSLQQRVKIDQKIQQRYGGMVNKLSVKLMKVVKKKEIEKVKKSREKTADA